MTSPGLSSRRHRSLPVLLAAALLAGSAGEARAAAALAVADLRCEQAANPLGVDTREPRLGWRLTSRDRGERQTAYQILVASTEALLAQGRGDLWDSGKTTSGESNLVPYKGAPLRPRQRAHWKVRVWDARGQATGYSAPAWWEMSLLDPGEWKGHWIGVPAGWSGRALYFRRPFETKKPVSAARVYVSGLGYYELHLDGAKIGDHVLDPGWTAYDKRVLYATYDVTSALKPGRHMIGAVVGHGWYGTPKLLLQLEITYADGTTERIASIGGHPADQPAWSASAGPWLRDSVFDGEEYDARLEKHNWAAPGRSNTEPYPRGEGWTTPVHVPPPGGVMQSQTLEPIRVVETRAPARMTEPKPGVFVFDTGQNLAGWAALRVRGERGTTITLRFGEYLAKDGTVDQANLRKALATDRYTLKGGGEETWEPRFTYHGFRYVQVEGFPGRPGPNAIAIRVVRSSVEPNGTFSSSHPLLGRIHEMVRWTEMSNLHSVPTDCPQRNERMGWMNDLTVRIDQALYNFDLARFYSKFLDDVRDTQAADGTITDTVPYTWGRRPADPVSVSFLLLAWEHYQRYGDTRPMAKHFDGFRAWVDYVAGTAQDGVVPWGSWGDWAPPANVSVQGSIGAGAMAKNTPLPLTSTGYLYYSAMLLSQMAAALGNADAQKKYQDLAARTHEAFNRAFFVSETGGYGKNNQAANSLALAFGLVPEAQRARVLENLVADVKAHDHHLTTGNLCTKYLMEVLTEGGRTDVAFRIATQETYPSWGFMLANGATTVWERWEYLTGGQMNSHNHPMMGSVGSWFYKYLAGIRPDPAGPGFRRFIVRPHPVAGLDWVRATYRSPYGLIESAWRTQGGRFSLRVSVPVGSTATVFVPGAAARITEGGRPVARAPGVRVVRQEGDTAVLEAVSGSYEFVSPR